MIGHIESDIVDSRYIRKSAKFYCIRMKNESVQIAPTLSNKSFCL